MYLAPDADGAERVCQALGEDFLDLEPGAVGPDEQVEFAVKPVGYGWYLAIFPTE